MSLILIALFLLMPTEVMRAAREALDMCLVSVIPALFPFMTAAKCAVLSRDINEDNFIFRFLSRAFNIPLAGVWSFLFGLICGYPIGAKTAFDLCREKRIKKGEAVRLSCFTNNAGPAFVIGVCGGGFLKSASLGALVYICHISGGIILGLLLRGRGAVSVYAPSKKQGPSLTEIIPRAVSDSVSGVLNVSGIIIFFAALCSAVFRILPAALTASPFERGLITGIFEITSGIKIISEAFVSLPLKLSAVCFLTGFSGLSVIFQTKSFASGLGIKLTPCILCKVFSSLISSCLCYAAATFLI